MMDLQKAKILLEKINALYNNMSADKKNISTIERDLMKSYVQQFYEVFIDVPHTPVRKAVEVIKSTPRTRPVTNVIKKKAAPAPPPPPPPPAPKPEPPKPVPPKVTEVAPPPPPPKPEPPKPAPAPPKPKPVPVAVSMSEDMEELFAFNSAKELSEKLSEMPLSDINKGMGLNERILTVNELFKGDQAAFKVTIDTLNKLSNYEEAQTFLVNNAATKYNWTAKTRKKKAKNFIKLIKRRYN